MRKSIAVVMAVLILSFPGLASAQMEKEEGMMDHKGMDVMGHEMPKDGMMDKGGMKDMCPMMKSSGGRTVIATSDGGVVVVTGNTMVKYDQDLDVTGQVELKGCPECMKKMKAGCPMMGKGMGMVGELTAAETAGVPADPMAVIEPAAIAEPSTEVKSETAAEPAVAAEPASAQEPSTQAAAEPVTPPAAEPAIIIEPAAETQPAAVEPAGAANVNATVEEGNNTEQK